MTEIKLKIEGMTCSHCQMSVKKALLNVNGVKNAEVDLENHSAMIKYKDGKTEVAKLIEAVKNAGYKAELA